MAEKTATKTKLVKPTSESTSLKVQNVAKIDAKQPVPIEFNGLAFTTLGGYRYIPFFAPEDNLFRTLLEARLLSPTQGNCINDKVFYSLGKGLQVKDQTFPTDFDKQLNGKRQTIDDILRAVFDSYFQDGNKFVEVVRTTVGDKKYIRVYPHNNMDCRLEEPGEKETDPTHMIRSKLLRRNGIYTFKKEDEPIRIPLWNDTVSDPKSVWQADKNDPSTERTMILIKNECTGYDYYGMPSNFAGLANAILEYKCARYNMDNFDNNMFLGGILTLAGNMSKDEERKFVQNLRRMYVGDGKYGRILPMTSETGASDSKFTSFDQKHEGSFTDFDAKNEDKIIAANSWSRQLLDVKVDAGLGRGGNYLKQLFKIKFKTVIEPAQAVVMYNFIFPLMKIIDEWKNTKFYDLPWMLSPEVPLSFEGDLDVNSLITVDEGRSELGKDPDENTERGKKLIAEIAPAKVAAGGPQPNPQPAAK